MAADSGGDGDGFVPRLSAVFARELFQPMFQRASQAPADVRQLIGEMREKLDALDLVIRTCPGGEGAARPSMRAAFMSGGAVLTAAADGDDTDAWEDIGRNQRSRLRELTMLEAMSRESRAYSLQQVMTALESKGFGDTAGAVVSQLHRLKKLGVVNQPANGMYEITVDGLGHLRKLRSSFGALMGEVR